MDPVTHAAAGLICSRLIASPARGGAALAGVLFALLPDIDYFLVFWDRLAFIRHHRGITHSLVVLPLLALAGAAVGRRLGGPRWFRPLFLLGLLALASHLFLDLATSYGTQILSPFTSRRFTLDLIFIFDPWFTLTLLLGAGGAIGITSTAWGRRVAWWSLAAAGVYLFICGFYHQQAVSLAWQLFQPTYLGRADCGLIRRLPKDLPWQVFPPVDPGKLQVAALPQPFSCRRWHLLARDEDGVRQAFVEIPLSGALEAEVPEGEVAARGGAVTPGAPYQLPWQVTRRTWVPAVAEPITYSAESREILGRFLEFARFPLLLKAQRDGREQVLEWLDVRFALPGRAVPFVLNLHLDQEGRLKQWTLSGWGNPGKSYGSQARDLRERLFVLFSRLLGLGGRQEPFAAGGGKVDQ